MMTPPVSAAVALISAWVWMMFWATTTDNTTDARSAEWIEPTSNDDQSESSSETTTSNTAFHTADD